MKKILTIFIILIIVFVIYLSNIDKKVYYLSLGNLLNSENNDKDYTEYIKEYLESKNKLQTYINYSEIDYRITDIINDINNNKKIENKNTSLKQALVKADLLTISIGMNDLFTKINNKEIINNNLYKVVDAITNDLNNLLKLIREYCKEDIILIGYYYPIKYINNKTILDIIDYADSKFKEICESYNIKYLEIKDKINKEFLDKEGYYPTKEGYQILAREVINEIDKKLLK